jgi:hypothetical protein
MLSTRTALGGWVPLRTRILADSGQRLKENEEFIWRLADRQLDEFVADGRCEFIRAFAARRPPVRLRADLDTAWAVQPAPGVHPGAGQPVSRVAVVTGGASGIGLGVVRRFLADGHLVALLDLNGADKAAAEVGSEPGTVLPVEVDVADRASVDAAFATVRAELGPVEILVTSAGIESFDDILDIDQEIRRHTHGASCGGGGQGAERGRHGADGAAGSGRYAG